MTDTETEVWHLVNGAVGVALAITAFGLLLHFTGVRPDLFRDGWYFVWDLVYGFVTLVAVVTVVAGFIQYLSEHFPIPPVIKNVEENNDD